MANHSPFPSNIFVELDRMQRDMQQAFGFAPAIRGSNWGGFPAMNMYNTVDTAHVYVFLPGIKPADITVQIEKGVLVISGGRKAGAAGESSPGILHIDERFSGRFRRVITLPDDINDAQADASYRDGILHISLQRQRPTEARNIPVQ